MTRARWLVNRVAFAVVAAYAVVTVAFLFVALVADPNLSVIRHNMARSGASAAQIEAAMEAYRASRNLDQSLLSRWVNWMVNVTLLDWGRSFQSGTPVTALLATHLRYTLAYVVPGTLLSLVGVGVGMHAASRAGSAVDRFESVVSYIALGVPNFFLAKLVVVYVILATPSFDTSYAVQGAWDVTHYGQFLPPALVLATGLYAGLMRYTRAQSMEYLGATFVKVLKAKGASRLRVARHVLRNGAIPILSLFTTELVAIVVLNVFVIEYVFNIPGLGTLTYGAVMDRDMPVIIGTTLVVVFVGIGGNLLQDAAYYALDPRIGDGE
ncbi:ABC transporter permease [Halobium salinum]|uniref:ABC transporter permease n=1 Tax=Halobium salinum TaxID=1364940 RepID=A0ABD5P6G9_9EURY|nr:ABC transporter permease [Halobium salinum]